MDTDSASESTIRIDPTREMPWLDTGLDLLVLDAEGRESRWQICRAVMQIGRCKSARPNDVVLDSPGIAERQAVLHFQDSKVLFLNSNQACPAKKAGTVVSFCEMRVGEEISLGDFRLMVAPHEEGMASLEGYSPPYRGRRWFLLDGPNPIGRPGKRDNRVQLEDLTVSRTHATILNRGGAFYVRPDSEVIPTFVNGKRVDDERALEDGDLVQLGVQILRFRISHGPAKVAKEGLVPQETTILFADIWNYAALSESRPLDEFIRQVSEFYEMVDRVITEKKGLLTTYLGDAVVAIFGSAGPQEDDAARAIQAAVAIQQEIKAINKDWLQAGLPPFGVGVGIHTGDVIIGDVSLRGNSELAAVGGEANTAANIEKLTKEHDVKILVSSATAAVAGSAFPLRSIGSVKLEGRSNPIELFEVQY